MLNANSSLTEKSDCLGSPEGEKVINERGMPFMTPLVEELFSRYYQKGSRAYNILLEHSLAVSQYAIDIVQLHSEWHLDKDFIREAGMLHDIGIFATHAPAIGCYGRKHYLEHGVVGSKILTRKGHREYALICERHTGVGLSKIEIIQQGLPLPHRDMVPVSLEEKIICYADCFFSKSKTPSKKKSVDQIIKNLKQHSPHHALKFRSWVEFFGMP